MQNEFRIIGGKTCRLNQYLFTCSIQVGVDGLGHERRYCYEHEQDARMAMAAWDGQGHPPGPWIKCKSASQELLNPAWVLA